MKLLSQGIVFMCVKSVFLLLLSSFTSAQSFESSDDAFRKRGFKSEKHFYQCVKKCSDEYERKVSKLDQSPLCFGDYFCIESEKSKTEKRMIALLSSKTWKNNHCSVVLDVIYKAQNVILDEAPSHDSRQNQVFEIQASHNDEIFVINNAKFEAQSYCFNMEIGDKVIFVEGDASGACATAAIFNLRTNESCQVFCE